MDESNKPKLPIYKRALIKAKRLFHLDGKKTSESQVPPAIDLQSEPSVTETETPIPSETLPPNSVPEPNIVPIPSQPKPEPIIPDNTKANPAVISVDTVPVVSGDGLISSTCDNKASKYEALIPDDHDVVIVIMGPTGVGKTTFINSLKSSYSGVHHDLTSGTKDVNVIKINLEDTGKRLVLVDTPGFDDSERTNADILACVAAYLEKTYRDKKMLDGMIYLHRITDIRFDSGSSTSLNIFRKLFGDDHFERLALVTTMWNDVAPGKEDMYVSREDYMKREPWAVFLQRTNASLVARFNCGNDETNSEAAKLNVLDIVTGILVNSMKADASREKKSPGFVVQLQRELVDQGKALPRTEAGKAAYTLAETARFYLKQVSGS